MSLRRFARHTKTETKSEERTEGGKEEGQKDTPIRDQREEPWIPRQVQCGTRLLYHMSRIFEENLPHQAHGSRFTDSKLRQEIREKKIAHGHKEDDHEQDMSMQ